MSAMTVDQRPAQSHLGVGGYDSMRYSSGQPQFTNPWASGANGTANGMYQAPVQHHQPALSQPANASRTGSMSLSYAANPAASTMGSSEWLTAQDNSSFDLTQMPDLVPSRSYDTQQYHAPKLEAAYTSAPRHSPEQVHSYSPYGYDADISRRSSYQPSDSSRSFSDVVDASRGMVAMSQSSYGTSRTSSQDSYGFPSSHSSSSSISSGSAYPYYQSYGSVDHSSMTDYSSASEDALATRTLPAPSQLISAFPPDQNTMMNQFNSKMAPNAQKKHKCKICDKRFTRPSSLQTHMYSHTGEKPFACDHEGCGRHFSVVSNLRRHKKVHKEDGGDSGSPNESED